jgi:hypothetical protein
MSLFILTVLCDAFVESFVSILSRAWDDQARLRYRDSPGDYDQDICLHELLLQLEDYS